MDSTMQHAEHMQTSASRTCIIFAAGEYYDEMIEIPDDAFVIAADGGWDHAQAVGARVDVLVGDFDSIDHTPQDSSVETLVLPAQKDDPDLLTALKIGWEKGARLFHIYGGLGGRIDHTISNIQLMTLVASRGGIGFLHGNTQIVTAVCDGTLHFSDNTVPNGTPISVFAHSDTARGVSEPGLRYELVNATMTNTQVNGLSNEFIDGHAAQIRVEHGTLVVVFPSNAGLPTVSHLHEFSGDLGAISTQVSAVLVQSSEA